MDYLKKICSYFYRHFALVHPANSVVVRATYGPFSVRQTINPFSVPRNVTSTPVRSKSGQKKSPVNDNITKQITAYLVTKEVRRSHPVLRVLFYASHLFEFPLHPQFNSQDEDKTLCAAIIGNSDCPMSFWYLIVIEFSPISRRAFVWHLQSKQK